MRRLRKWLLRLLVILPVIYLLLLIPDSGTQEIVKPATKAFAWNKDAQWDQLEADFKQARLNQPTTNDSIIKVLLLKAATQFDGIVNISTATKDSVTDHFLANFFSLSAYIAVRPQFRDSLINYYNRVRNGVKQRSGNWDVQGIEARNVLYQLLYGMRAAVEEVLLQSPDIKFDPAMMVKEEFSATPYTEILGIKVHSGDLLVSRGGAEVSALISRGNDYPGNFSHVALVYIDDKNNVASLIEAHIEKGVALASVDQYVKDKKLRFMVLRPKADLPALVRDPMLPQRAAKTAYEEAIKRHIPYDFKMNFYDSSMMFCSEVGSYAYRKNGIQLWQAVSTISSQGVINWLGAFGVENFVTQMPSDLEYDPQLSVVAEWRDPETLFKDHIDNAVMDVLLEKADKGEEINYNKWQLPFVRIVKAWCMIKNYFGGIGMIPEGMSATQALKNQTFVALYNDVKRKTQEKVDVFIKQNGYRPPYWQLIKLAREAGQMSNH